MQLNSIQLSQVAKFIQIIGPHGGIYYPDAVRAIQTRYGFVKAPQTLQELDEKAGIAFLHGKFQTPDGPIVIRQLMYHENSISAQSGSTTENVDLFLTDLIAWMSKEFSLEVKHKEKFPDWCDSQLEVCMNVDIGGSPDEKASELAAAMNAIIVRYGHGAKIRPVGFIFAFDPSILPLHGFTLDRRAGKPFVENVYWSRAPFQTKDHLDVLALIERLALNVSE